MYLLAKCEKVGEVRSFQNGRGEQVTAMDMEFSVGAETFLVTAFDKVVTAVQAGKPAVGALYWIDVHFAVNGTEKRFQSVRLTSISAL